MSRRETLSALAALVRLVWMGRNAPRPTPRREQPDTETDDDHGEQDHTMPPRRRL